MRLLTATMRMHFRPIYRRTPPARSLTAEEASGVHLVRTSFAPCIPVDHPPRVSISNPFEYTSGLSCLNLYAQYRGLAKHAPARSDSADFACSSARGDRTAGSRARSPSKRTWK